MVCHALWMIHGFLMVVEEKLELIDFFYYNTLKNELFGHQGSMASSLSV